MTDIFVGAGGNDANSGLTWALRLLTLTKAATVVAAGGDRVFVGAGTYREQVAFTVSGGNNYSTGTVTVANGSTTVTGLGTTFTGGNVAAGYYFKCGGAGAIKIAAVNSATEIILESAYDGASAAGASYMTFNPIHWIGDYDGTHTDGVGGVVRWTGSADDTSHSRASWITASSVNYNRISGFSFDAATTGLALINPQYWIIDKSSFQGHANAVSVTGASQLGVTVGNSIFQLSTSYAGGGDILFSHSSTVNNTLHSVQNCIIQNAVGEGTSQHGGVNSVRVGGIYVKNCDFFGLTIGVCVSTALAAGQSIFVTNCIFAGLYKGVAGTATTEIIEDYNNFYQVPTSRTSTNVGANSIAYPPLFDTRWFFEMVK